MIIWKVFRKKYKKFEELSSEQFQSDLCYYNFQVVESKVDYDIFEEDTKEILIRKSFASMPVSLYEIQLGSYLKKF